MKYNSSPAMMIAEEDIQELVQEWGNVPEWVKSHLQAKYPAHRYEGEVTSIQHIVMKVKSPLTATLLSFTAVTSKKGKTAN